MKFGFEYRNHNFPFNGWGAAEGGQFNFNRLGTAGYDAAGNNLAATGDPFASFLLGQVQDATQTVAARPTFNEAYTALWVNDEFKVSNNLTLTLGMRIDYQTARTESNDEYSTFDPNTPNPAAGNIPGALIFAGSGEGRSGRRTFENPKWDAWGPGSALHTGWERSRRSKAVTGFTTRGSPSTSSLASRRLASRRTCWRRTRPTARPRPSTWTTGSRRIECSGRHSSTRIPGRRLAHRGASGWIDAAALRELVGDLPAPAHRQHDAGRVLHRQPRDTAEPPLPDARRRRQHERSVCAGFGRQRPAVEHQLACCTEPPTSRSLIRDSTGTSRRHCESSRSTRGSNGVVFPPGRASTMRWSSCSSGVSRGVSRPGSGTPSPG